MQFTNTSARDGHLTFWLNDLSLPVLISLICFLLYKRTLYSIDHTKVAGNIFKAQASMVFNLGIIDCTLCHYHPAIFDRNEKLYE